MKQLCITAGTRGYPTPSQDTEKRMFRRPTLRGGAPSCCEDGGPLTASNELPLPPLFGMESGAIITVTLAGVMFLPTGLPWMFRRCNPPPPHAFAVCSILSPGAGHLFRKPGAHNGWQRGFGLRRKCRSHRVHLGLQLYSRRLSGAQVQALATAYAEVEMGVYSCRSNVRSAVGIISVRFKFRGILANMNSPMWRLLRATKQLIVCSPKPVFEPRHSLLGLKPSRKRSVGGLHVGGVCASACSGVICAGERGLLLHSAGISQWFVCLPLTPDSPREYCNCLLSQK